MNCLNIGVACYKAGYLDKSVDHLDRALAYFTDFAIPISLTRTHIALGNVHRLLEDHTTARKHLTQAYTLAAELKVPREECLALEFLGDVYRDEGKPEEARRYYARGMAIAQEIAPRGDLVMELRRREGECLTLEGKVAAALPVLNEARKHAARLGDRYEEGVTLRCLAQAMQAIGDVRNAQRYAEEACDLLGAIEARLEHLSARLVAGQALIARSSDVKEEVAPRDLLDAAWEHGVAAQALSREVGIASWSSSVQRMQSRIAKRRMEETRYAVRRVQSKDDRYEARDVIVAQSRSMQEVLQAVEAFAPYDEPVLVIGETGTGKEVIARRLHELSPRQGKPFVAVNMTAVPTTMFEREFFGHVRGAFSGAEMDRTGYAAEADGGTLFLDEVGDMPSEVQAKLLRLLQDGSYNVLGDPDTRYADLRVIAATNLDLEEAVAQGKFREDLFYRLRILEIHLAPLRKRPEDVLPLLEHFLSEAVGRKVAATDYFSTQSLGLLQRYPWAGNAREVALIARRAAISQKVLGVVDVELGSGRDALVLAGPGRQAKAAAGSSGAGEVAELSRARLLLALEEAGGNRAEAARRLGISRAALYRRLERFGFD